MTLILFILVLGGMIFLHELGHFLAARFFKIPVEEFGFGLPPRLWTFWREKGSLSIDAQEVDIPTNFKLPFDWHEQLHKQVKASADRVNDRLVLRSIEAINPDPVEEEDSSAPLVVDANGKVLGRGLNPLPMAETPKAAPVVVHKGEVKLEGVLSRIDAGTEFTLNWLPIGGFVRARGENDPNVPDGLSAANPWQRLGVFFAGPAMNLLTAIVVYAFALAQMGIPITDKVLVDDVTPDSPAALAGFQAKDLLVKINGQAVTDIAQARTLIRQNMDTNVEFDIERDGRAVTIMAMPLSSRPVDKGALGVLLGNPSRPAKLGELLIGGVTMTGWQAYSILNIPIGLIRGVIQPSEARLVGLKGIYDTFDAAMARDAENRQAAANASGGAPIDTVSYTILLVGMLSVSLGVMNLLPIPALDGGRILFTLPEILFRRRIPTRFELLVNGVALMMLIGLMLFINVMDFVNPQNVTLP